MPRDVDSLHQELQEVVEGLRQTNKAIAQTNKAVAGLGDGNGLLSQHMLGPTVGRVLAAYGIRVSGTTERFKRELGGETMEIDVLGLGKMKRRRSQVVIVVEIKYRFSESDVRKFLERMPRFPEFFPEYAELPIVGVIGGLIVPGQVRESAQKKGLFVLVPGENIARAVNPPGFRPRLYGAARPRAPRKR